MSIGIAHVIKNYAVIIELKHRDGQTDEQVRKRKENIDINGGYTRL